MIYSPLVKKACEILFTAHRDDVDKNGYPYVMHPLHVAESMTSEDACIVALLHDLIEDHGDEYSYEDLAKIFPSEVIEGLKYITHEKGVEYMENIRKIGENKLATEVKISDLKHNLDISRLDGKKPPKYETYVKALEYLEGLGC